MHGRFLSGISHGTFGIQHKIAYLYVERYESVSYHVNVWRAFMFKNSNMFLKCPLGTKPHKEHEEKRTGTNICMCFLCFLRRKWNVGELRFNFRVQWNIAQRILRHNQHCAPPQSYKIPLFLTCNMTHYGIALTTRPYTSISVRPPVCLFAFMHLCIPGVCLEHGNIDIVDTHWWIY